MYVCIYYLYIPFKLEIPYSLYPAFPHVNILYNDRPILNQNIYIAVSHRTYSDFTSCTCKYLCVWFYAISSCIASYNHYHIVSYR